MASQELDYLAELIADFPVEGSRVGSVEDAESLLQLRYQALLDTLVDSKEVLKRLRSIPDAVDFPVIFEPLTKSLHQILFRGILSNAGNQQSLTMGEFILDHKRERSHDSAVHQQVRLNRRYIRYFDICQKMLAIR